LNATRAAVEEGVVPGGGCALLYASKSLENLKVKNEDQLVGVKIVEKAVQVPSKTIVQNAGGEGSVIAGKLLETNDFTMGYDSFYAEYKNMMEAGIIDPVKVVRTALSDAASVAGLLTTTEAVIVDEPPKKKGRGAAVADDDDY